MTVYGYARVSTRDQDLTAQDAELATAGCAKVFKEKISGARSDRPELAKVIPGLALFMLAGLVFLLAGTQSTLDRRAIWERVTWASEAAP